MGSGGGEPPKGRGARVCRGTGDRRGGGTRVPELRGGSGAARAGSGGRELLAGRGAPELASGSRDGARAHSDQGQCDSGKVVVPLSWFLSLALPPLPLVPSFHSFLCN